VKQSVRFKINGWNNL